jgi:hypothetical protein
VGRPQAGTPLSVRSARQLTPVELVLAAKGALETRDPWCWSVRAPVRVCVSDCLCMRPSKWVKVRAHTHTSNRAMQSNSTHARTHTHTSAHTHKHTHPNTHRRTCRRGGRPRDSSMSWSSSSRIAERSCSLPPRATTYRPGRRY